MSCSSYLVMLFVGVVVLTAIQLRLSDPYHKTTTLTTNDHKLPPNPFLNHPEEHKPPLAELLLQQPPRDQLENPQSEHDKPPTLPARRLSELRRHPRQPVVRPSPARHRKKPPPNVASTTPPLA